MKYDYHHDYSRISQSALKIFAESPELYRRKFLLAEDHPQYIPPDPPSDDMIIGAIAHSIFLDDPFPEEFMVSESDERRSNVWKETEEKAKAEGKTPVPKRLVDTATMIALSARDNANVLEFYESVKGIPQKREQILQWNAGFFPKRAKVDQVFYTEDKNNVVLVEFKTTNDVFFNAFQRKYFDMRYHIQAAWYEEGLRAWLPEAEYRHVVIVARNKPYYDCVVYEIDPDVIEAGRIEMNEDLEDLRDRISNDNWIIKQSILTVPYYRRRKVTWESS